MDLEALEVPKQVVDHPVFRDEIGLAQQVGPIEGIAVPMGQDVLGVQDAPDLVESFSVDGNPTETAFGKVPAQVGPRQVLREGRHIGPRGHDLLDILGAEVDDAAEDAVFLVGALLGVGDVDGVFQVLDGHLRRGGVHPPGQGGAEGIHREPDRAEDLLGQPQRPGHAPREGEGMPVGVDLGQDFAEQDDQEGHTEHVEKRAEPAGQSREPLLHQHGRQEDDEDVDRVVEDQNGGQEVGGGRWPHRAWTRAPWRPGTGHLRRPPMHFGRRGPARKRRFHCPRQKR